jgi:hypothetical protein
MTNGSGAHFVGEVDITVGRGWQQNWIVREDARGKGSFRSAEAEQKSRLKRGGFYEDMLQCEHVSRTRASACCVADGRFLADNNSPASTLGVQNSTTDTTAALAEFLAPNTPRSTSGENGCDIDTLGDLTCTGNIVGNTAFASASPIGPPAHRLASRARPSAQYASLDSMEAGNQWREDFGSAKLMGGVARVALDPDFARTLSTVAAYHVFFTPKADCKGLYIARETSTGFEVRELGGARSSLEFDYRVVGRRKLYRPIPAPAGSALAKAAASGGPAS